MEVLASLQKPKKITANASDGKSYILLCKPKVCICMQHIYVHPVIDYSVIGKDDLRKDARLMEFNSVINKVFCIIMCKFFMYAGL